MSASARPLNQRRISPTAAVVDGVRLGRIRNGEGDRGSVPAAFLYAFGRALGEGRPDRAAGAVGEAPAAAFLIVFNTAIRGGFQPPRRVEQNSFCDLSDLFPASVPVSRHGNDHDGDPIQWPARKAATNPQCRCVPR